VFELRPAIDWDKGGAGQWLLETVNLRPDATLPVYVGGDETDEDDFAVLCETGIGIAVAEQPRPTQSRYRLRDPLQVHTLPERLTRRLASSRQ
jgi:trehalose-phosphatase